MRFNAIKITNAVHTLFAIGTRADENKIQHWIILTHQLSNK